MLLVFGGLKGLESSLESDETLKESEVELLFDRYVNTCPKQGSRTIRTEVWVELHYFPYNPFSLIMLKYGNMKIKKQYIRISDEF